MNYKYTHTFTGRSKVINRFDFTRIGRVCIRLKVLKIKLTRIESYDDERAICHYRAGINAVNPFSWPVAMLIEIIGFVSDLWSEGVSCAFMEIGRSTHIFNQRVILRIGKDIVIGQTENGK